MMKNEPEVVITLDENAETVRGSRRKGHVLVVDDVRDIQQLFAEFSRIAGARVSFAENGQVAYQKAVAAWKSGHPFDLILMDICMPVLDGYAATRKLREAGYPGTIIAHTASDTAVHSWEKCLQAGCDDCMKKPISRKEFLGLVSGYLQDR